MAHIDPAQLGLDAVRVAALMALIRPDLVIQFPRHVIRQIAAEELLGARYRAARRQDQSEIPVAR